MPGEEMYRWRPEDLPEREQPFVPSAFDDVRKIAQWDPRPPFEPDPEWVAYFERVYSEALAWFENATLEFKYQGESPLASFMRRQGRADEDGPIYGTSARRLGIPRQEVNLSRETMDLLRDSLDVTLEYYGTSGDLDPRGYWMPIDEDAS